MVYGTVLRLHIRSGKHSMDMMEYLLRTLHLESVSSLRSIRSRHNTSFNFSIKHCIIDNLNSSKDETQLTYLYRIKLVFREYSRRKSAKTGTDRFTQKQTGSHRTVRW